MALNNVTTAISDGGNGGGNFDLNIDAEKFYYGYKIIEKETPVFDELSNTVLSITAKVNSLGVNFSNISNKIKNDNSELNDMYNRMISFKKTLERIDSSNTILFSNLDVIVCATFGGDITETDLALYGENCKQIYENAKNKDPKDLTNLEKLILNSYVPLPESFNNGLKLQEYIGLEKQYEEVNKDYQEIQSKIYNITRNYRGPMPEEQVAKVKTLVAKRDEYLKNMNSIKNKKDELRTELIDAGLIEKTSKESFTEAGKQLWNSFTDIFKTGGDLGGILVETDEFLSELHATGTVIRTNVEAGAVKVLEYVADGVIMVGGGLATIGTGAYDGVNSLYCKLSGADFSSATSTMWNGIMNEIAVDTTGKLYNSFYNSQIGQYINNTSALKYDSAGAIAVREVSTTATEAATIIVITAATGGTAAPVVAAGVGFLEGTGKAAESRFSTGNKSAEDIAMSYLAGGRTAANWYMYSGLVNKAFEYAPKLPEYLEKIENFGNNPDTRQKLNPSQYFNNAKNTITNNGKDIITSTFSKPNVYVSTAGNVCKNIENQLNKTGEINYTLVGVEILKRAVIGSAAEFGVYYNNIANTEIPIIDSIPIEEIEVPEVIDITD